MTHGMNKVSGKPLLGIEHLKQSIIDILTTPIRIRVMRREYGSRVLVANLPFTHVWNEPEIDTNLNGTKVKLEPKVMR